MNSASDVTRVAEGTEGVQVCLDRVVRHDFGT